MVLEMRGSFISFQLTNILAEMIQEASDQMADVRLGAKTVFFAISYGCNRRYKSSWMPNQPFVLRG
jgi:hypothetical protein